MPGDNPAAGFVPTATDAVTREIVAALSEPQKTLPARLFYDEAGCGLFGQITKLPEYYVTRAEMALLARHASEIAEQAPDGAALVEYGASDEAKAVTLLDAGSSSLGSSSLRAPRFGAYVPIDIAPAALEAIAGRMRGSHPGLDILPVAADFLLPLALPAAARDRPAFGFFPGSTIGNFRPPMVVQFLRSVRATLGQTIMGLTTAPAFVVGTDLRKDPSVLIPAYDDAAGITAAFNRNILRHVNRLTGADFDPDAFRHRAIWNLQEGRIEMHLQSRASQTVRLAGRTIHFAAGETIHTEDSYKHTRESFIVLANEAGWRSAGFWTDSAGLFGMHLLRG